MSTQVETSAQDTPAVSSERRLNMIEAINEALDVMLTRDDDVIVMGEDVG
ncbi:MAG: alpha-ketoacid dehydrogenase subunit beta, partial [Pseudomonadota bacterium]